MRIVLFSACIALLTACTTTPQKTTGSSNENFKTLNIIPKPISAIKTKGSFVISEGLCVSSTDSISAQASKTFIKGILQKSGVQLTTQSKEADIKFITSKEIAKEGYELEVTQANITLKASDASGFIYGLSTLYQLMPTNNYQARVKLQQLNVDCAIIKDAPAYHYRGLMLDVCRHFIKPREIKRVLDLMASQKLNIFHWHLTEDQAWRIEIKKYPKLTEVGAWRDGTGFDLDPKGTDNYRASDGKYGGFYTQEEIKEIVKYAADRGITIIPEIELPGHSMAALVSYPELGCTGGPYKMPMKGGVFTDVYCAGNEKVYKFLEDVITEVADLFPGPYIHIGGDECPKAQWNRCPKCQKMLRKHKLHNGHELQSYFVSRMEKIINSKGKKLIGWDEILEGGLAPNATVMSWRGMKGGIKAANMGHDVIMAPNTHVYFNFYQADKATEPKSFGHYLPFEKVYTFNPMPANISEDKRHHILGGQANLWSEYIQNSQMVEYMLAPRICALSESLWTPSSAKNWDNFLERMKIQYARFEAIGIRYRRPRDIVLTETKDGIILTPKAKGVEIVYTLDGSTPSLQSTTYTTPIKETRRVTLKASVVMPDGKVLQPLVKILNIPKFTVRNKFGINRGSHVEAVMDGSQDSVFWGRKIIKPGDTFTLIFNEPQNLSSIKVITGKKVNGGGSDSLIAGDRLEISRDGKKFTKVATFDHQGIAHYKGEQIKVKAIRLKATQPQRKWLMIREIEIH
jgi:hexosaminidase